MSELSKYGAEWMYRQMATSEDFPYYKGKRKRKKPHMKDVALLANTIYTLDDKTNGFDIGNTNAQQVAEHYAILENAPTIHYGNRRARRVVKNKDGTSHVQEYGKVRSWGTEKSRGSQQYVTDKGSMDYNKWSYGQSGNIRQEYRSSRGDKQVTETSTSYANKHYHYIERILDKKVAQLANELGGKMMRTTIDLTQEKIDVESEYMYQFDIE